VSHVNGGFWDLPADDRAAAEARAARQHGAADFFDLDPADRAAAYERATADYYGFRPGDGGAS
jgi:hypothetical protein